MKLTNETQAAWTALVLAEYPKEACAFIVDGALFPVPNLSETPEKSFKVAAVDRLAAHAQGSVEAFLHSHPYTMENYNPKWNPAWISYADMRCWIADNIPWGIVATDGEGLSSIVWYDDRIEAMEPLENREFVWGKNDCWTVMRDYYRTVLNIPTMMNFPRGAGWWEEGQNLYLQNFKPAGFVEVDGGDIRPNDILLMRIDTGVISHGALVVDTNKILHHCMNRLSGYDTLAKWHRQVEKVIRYKDFL